jgi:hypothetical protein
MGQVYIQSDWMLRREHFGFKPHAFLAETFAASANFIASIDTWLIFQSLSMSVSLAASQSYA